MRCLCRRATGPSPETAFGMGADLHAAAGRLSREARRLYGGLERLSVRFVFRSSCDSRTGERTEGSVEGHPPIRRLRPAEAAAKPQAAGTASAVGRPLRPLCGSQPKEGPPDEMMDCDTK